MFAIMPAMAMTEQLQPPLRRLSRWLAALCLLGGLMGCRPGRPTPSLSEASPPATPVPSVIEVLTEPKGASVSLDGKAHGETPQRIIAVPGVHTIEIAKEGFELIVAEVTAEASRKVTLSRTLRDVAAPRVDMGSMPERVGTEDGFKVSASAQDNHRVARMALWVNGQSIHEVEEPTLRFNVDTRVLPPGAHVIIVRAWDEAGNLGEAQATVEVTGAMASPTAAATATAAEVQSVTAPPGSRPTSAPAPTVGATAAPGRPAAGPVAGEWGEITVDTYAYEEALYTDEAGAGHPYALLHRDRVGGARPRTYRVLRLRNDYLELTFLPELGGRLYQARYLPTGQDLFYTNRTIKPSHWGPEDQGWWLAVGGMEWCLPVNEHGYVTAEPWDVSVSTGADGSATATMTLTERTRNVEARVAVTLRQGEAGFTVRTTLHNPNAETRSLQYWMNAMLSPGAPGVGSSLRFFYPASDVIVHSRGDASLPDAGSTMSWPTHDDRDMSRYANWRDWLGFFAPNLSAPYTAVYDDVAELGMVRVFPPETVRGSKLFAFGLGFGDSRVYTDDGSQYVEMWSGLSPTFWDDVTLGPNDTVSWSETWYAIAGTGGLTTADEEGALTVSRDGSTLHISIGGIGERRWTLRVFQGDREVASREVTVRPDAAYREDLALEGVGVDAVTVRVEDAEGRIVMACES